ncbi:MAG TPA: GNAT family N-acetyltransferase [Streptosporangiaceae bacterium]
MTQLTLIAEGRAADTPGLAAGFAMRPPAEGDAGQLGRLYFDAGVPYANLAHPEAAVEEIQAFFRGEFGDCWPGASGVVEHDGRLVAALLAVHRAPWGDTPDGPFITDLFTDPGFRRRGLGRALIARCLDAVHRSARQCAALRVESENAPAVRLYRSFGFRPYAPPE